MNEILSGQRWDWKLFIHITRQRREFHGTDMKTSQDEQHQGYSRLHPLQPLHLLRQHTPMPQWRARCHTLLQIETMSPTGLHCQLWNLKQITYVTATDYNHSEALLLHLFHLFMIYLMAMWVIRTVQIQMVGWMANTELHKTDKRSRFSLKYYSLSLHFFRMWPPEASFQLFLFTLNLHK
jgi:hypothetical protein